MSRRLTFALTLAASAALAAINAHAGCSGSHCQTRYGRYTAREAYVLFQRHPELIQRFPQIARQLETQFGPLQPAAAQTPVVANPSPVNAAAQPIAAPPATTVPAAASQAAPAIAEQPAAPPAAPPVDQEPPSPAPPVNETVAPAEATLAEAAAESAVTEDIEDVIPQTAPDAPPDDLPLGDPPADF